jgi:hypothetical protein
MLTEKEEKILGLVRMGGPVLPIKVSKALDVETYLAGALLSTLVGNGHLKLSHKKIGSSPIYYIPGQEPKVREMLYTELNDLEKKTLERIKEMKVALESDLYPQERFLLKGLIDFATPLTLTFNNETLNIWKYNVVSDEELNQLLKSRFDKKEAQPSSPAPENVPAQIKVEEPKLAEPKTESLSTVFETPEKPARKRKAKAPSEFIKKVRQYLDDKSSEISEEKVVSNGEHLFSITVKTQFGAHDFLAKAKDKSSISESDLSQFYLECMNQKKPGILFVPKELNKKLEQFLEKNVGKLIKIVVLK